MRKQPLQEERPVLDFTDDYPVFTHAMKDTHTILVPDMLPWHFDLLAYILRLHGYRVEVLHNEGRAVIDEGLKHVHNDACYPALCVIGQFLDALKSGKYDPDKTAVMITQTGGGCRASNYLPLIRKALKAEFPQVPVLSFNVSGLEKDSGFEMSLGLILEFAYAVFYGDLIMSLYNQTAPYEKRAGEAAQVRQSCLDALKPQFAKGSYRKFAKHAREIIAAFSAIPVTGEKKIKVGIVGEIYVKYSPLANSHLEEFLLHENCEPVVPSLMDFLLYCAVNPLNDAKFYEKKSRSTFLFRFVYKWVYGKQKKLNHLLAKSKFEPMHDFERLRVLADKVINQGVKMGEGWLIPAEMSALCETGVSDIICVQPFGCLPNHIAGKGASRAVKALYPKANIVPVDYDPSATKVNQENRIKLMLATARENRK